MNQSTKTVLLWLLLIVIFVTMYHFFKSSPDSSRSIKYSELAAILNKTPNRIRWIAFSGNTIRGELRGGPTFKSRGPATEALLAKLDKAEIKYHFKKKPYNAFTSAILPFAPVLLLLLILIYLTRQVRLVLQAASLLAALRNDIQQMFAATQHMPTGARTPNLPPDGPG